MNKLIPIVVFILFSVCCLSSYSMAEVPLHVFKAIENEYAERSLFTAGMTSVVMQKNQVFEFTSHNLKLAVVPFTYLPKEVESYKQCVLRVVSGPGMKAVQDLYLGDGDAIELPCNGVIALGFRDLNSDGYNDILALYSFQTPGNPSLKPLPAICLFEPDSLRFRYNKEFSGVAERSGADTINKMINCVRQK